MNFTSENSEPAANRRRNSPILWRYLSWQFVTPLVCCLCGFAALFAVLDILDVLEDFLSVNADNRRIFLYFILQQACNLPHVLPMSLLLSASFTVSSMGRHHEITAVRAAGISLLHWLLPLWITGILISGFSFWLNEKIIPAASAQVEILKDELERGIHKHAAVRQVRLAYRNAQERRNWFFNSAGDDSYYGVLVKQFRKDMTIDWELRAESAAYINRSWIFYQAMLTQYDELGELPIGPDVNHEEYSNPELREPPSQIRNSLRPAEELSIRQMQRLLRQRQNLPASLIGIFETTIWHRRVLPFSCLVAVLLGASLAIAKENSSPLKGLSIALGILIVYYLTMHLFVLFGKHGLLPPPIAGVAPTLVFLFWGGYEAYKRR